MSVSTSTSSRTLSSNSTVFYCIWHDNSELLQSALGGSFLFGVNDLLKRLFGVPANTHEEAVTFGLVMAAFGTGAMDGVTSKPLEMIKLRQQTAEDHHVHMSIAEGYRAILKEGGIGCLFRGWIPTMLREALGNAAFFAAYHETKNFITFLEKQKRARKNAIAKAESEKQQKSVDGTARRGSTPTATTVDESNPPSSDLAIMIAGAAAGLGYVIASHPLETASVLMQIDLPKQIAALGKTSWKYQYASVQDCLKQVVSREGYKGLYRGAAPTIIRSLPQYAASFWGYEATLLLIERLKKERRKRLHLPEPVVMKAVTKKNDD